jgi:hypothetical protein
MWNAKGDYVPLGYWSTLEGHISIICACMPAMRAFARRLFPKVFGDTQHNISRDLSPGPPHYKIIPLKPKRHESDIFPLVHVESSMTNSQNG